MSVSSPLKQNGSALPTGWEQRPLGDIASITMGNSPPGDSYNEDGRGVPLVNGPVEFGKGAFGHTVKSKFTTAPTKMCKKGEFLICVRGSTTGRTNIAAFDACIGRGVASIRSHLHQGYLNHFIRTHERQIHASGKGSTFPSISQEQLHDLQVPVPFAGDRKRSITEQKRIADILDKADAIRHKRQETIKALEEYPHSLFGELFGHPDQNPKNWPVMRFEEVAESRLGKMLDAKQQTGEDLRPYMRNLNVQWGQLDLSEVFEMDFGVNAREEFRLQYGDVLICEGGAGVGQTAIWRDEIPECYFQKSLHRVRPYSDKATPEFVLFLMWTLMKGSSLLGSISSATIPHLTGVKLKQVRVPVPPIELQKEFQQQVQKYESARINARIASQETDCLFNSLVQLAFKGEI